MKNFKFREKNPQFQYKKYIAEIPLKCHLVVSEHITNLIMMTQKKSEYSFFICEKYHYRMAAEMQNIYNDRRKTLSCVY